jgi:putative RecB family exonuclease
VHAAFEDLYWQNGRGKRSEEAALDHLAHQWQLLQEDEEFIALGLGEKEHLDFYEDAQFLVRNYFILEDPNKIDAVGVELRLSAKFDDLWVRGIIDRLDRRSDGTFVIVDYKTGKAPGPAYEQAKLAGVFTYAYLCEAMLGIQPVAVKLLHLREPTEIVAPATAQKVGGQQKRTMAVFRAIESSCNKGEFTPKPGPLCKFCSFQQHCPTFGNLPPPLPQ